MTDIRIATRASALALWQANHVAGLLRDHGHAVELVEVTTRGDANQVEPLSKLSTSADGGSTGLFTKEVQRAVLDGRADVAVHSLKDLPTDPVDGLTLAAVPERAARHDVLVFAKGSGADSLDALPTDAIVGTGSLRRAAQLKHWRGDLRTAEIRGNVDTRLAKLDGGDFDAIVLAAAGLDRLGFDAWPAVSLAGVMLPAVSQGALGLECRTGDETVAAALRALSCERAYAEVTAERTLLNTLRAGCHAAVGAMTAVDENGVSLRAAVLSDDGQERIAADGRGDAAAVGHDVAGQLLDAGAGQILGSG